MEVNFDTTKILMVEDSATQAFQLKFLLEENNFQVLDASDGEEALALLKEHDVSLVVSDIQMPGMNGFELCKIIKSSEKTAHIPVVLLTSLSGKKDVLHGIESGADSFINKPYSGDYLMEHLKSILSQFSKLKPDNQMVRFEAFIDDDKFSMQANPRRMVSLLTSTYEGARYKNQDLIKSQEALENLNIELEEEVRKRTQEVIRSEKKYRNLVENALVGVYTTKLNGDFVFVNEAFAKMLEFESVGDLMNAGPVTQYYKDLEDRKRFLKHLEKFGQAGQFEFDLKTRKGNIRSVTLSAQLDKELISGMVMDITKLKQAEFKIREINAGLEKRVQERTRELDIANKELQKEIEVRKKAESDIQKAKEVAEEATRAKSIFLANMSHEIRTPMNALLGFTEILSRRISDPVQKNYLESMKKSGNALLLLINDLLDLSKAEAQKLELSPESINIRYVLADIKEILQNEARQKNIDFICTVAEDIPGDFFIDELRIRQVLMNLAGNAIKFTEKGHVKINIYASHISEKKADLIMEVEDTGKGIPKKFHDKIFNLFEQQSGEINKKYGGTGMGLSISRQIVDLMKGRIDLESEEGKGSIFKVVLPRIPRTGNPDEKKIDKPEESGVAVQFEPARILIADDAADNLLVLDELLKSFSFEVVEAQNGQEALEQMEKNNFDLILTDVRMPVMDGLEFVKRVRKNEKWAKIPVISLSASDSKFEAKNYKKIGFDALLLKPITFGEIECVLKKFLKYSVVKTEKVVEEVAVSESTKKHAQEIFQEIDEKVLPLQERLLKIRPRKIVAEMALALTEIGNKYKTPEVLRYGNALISANENFQVAIEKKLIDDFLPWYHNLVDSCGKK